MTWLFHCNWDECWNPTQSLFSSKFQPLKFLLSELYWNTQPTILVVMCTLERYVMVFSRSKHFTTHILVHRPSWTRSVHFLVVEYFPLWHSGSSCLSLTVWPSLQSILYFELLCTQLLLFLFPSHILQSSCLDIGLRV